jgi:hypothetical protein
MKMTEFNDFTNCHRLLHWLPCYRCYAPANENMINDQSFCNIPSWTTPVNKLWNTYAPRKYLYMYNLLNKWTFSAPLSNTNVWRISLECYFNDLEPMGFNEGMYAACPRGKWLKKLVWFLHESLDNGFFLCYN